MKRFCILALGVLLSASMTYKAAAVAFGVVVDEADVQAVSGTADVDFRELTVASDGTIFFVDQDPTANETLYKITFNLGNPTITSVTSELLIVAALNLVNGADTATSFNIEGIALDSSGNIIALGGDSGDDDGLVRISPAGAITVLETNTGSLSAVEGGLTMTVFNDRAYICREFGFGGSLPGRADDIVSLSVTGAGPNTAVSTFVSSSTLYGIIPHANPTYGSGTPKNGNIAMNTIIYSPAASSFYLSESGATFSSDAVLKITTGGLASVLLTSPTLVASLNNDNDISEIGIAVDGDSSLWFGNQFGGTLFDDGIINVTASGTITGFKESTILPFMGSYTNLTINNRSMAYDAAGNQILFTSEGTGPATFEGIGTIILPPPPIVGVQTTAVQHDWMIYQ